MHYRVKETFNSHLLKREINKGHFEKGESVEMDPKLAERFELLLEEDKEHKAPRKKKYRIKKDCEIPVLRKKLNREIALFKKGEEVSLDEETAKVFADYLEDPQKGETKEPDAAPAKSVKSPSPGTSAAAKEK